MRYCELLEPCASQEARTVLRGGGHSNVSLLPTKRVSQCILLGDITHQAQSLGKEGATP
jgi:hypothetical protein